MIIHSLVRRQQAHFRDFSLGHQQVHGVCCGQGEGQQDAESVQSVQVSQWTALCWPKVYFVPRSRRNDVVSLLEMNVRNAWMTRGWRKRTFPQLITRSTFVLKQNLRKSIKVCRCCSRGYFWCQTKACRAFPLRAKLGALLLLCLVLLSSVYDSLALVILSNFYLSLWAAIALSTNCGAEVDNAGSAQIIRKFENKQSRLKVSTVQLCLTKAATGS